MSRFKHPRAAQVLDHFVEDGRHYLKLEYINGTDLRQYVKQNGPVAQVQAIEWGIQILDVLQELHNLKLLHRDLTPENLVLRKDEIVLIDFGAANEFVGAATGTIVGKQAFMPPEQLRGKTVPESDIYAVGGTLHFLLTGKDPIPLSPANPKLLVPEIADELDAFVEKCTAFEATDRFHSAKEAEEALVFLLSRIKSTVAAIS